MTWGITPTDGEQKTGINNNATPTHAETGTMDFALLQAQTRLFSRALPTFSLHFSLGAEYVKRLG